MDVRFLTQASKKSLERTKVAVLDTKTGEVESKTVFNILNNGSKDINFEKIWLTDACKILCGLKSGGIKVFCCLITAKDVHNFVGLSQSRIANELNLSGSTVSLAIKHFKDMDFIRRIPGGYMVNPDVIFYGKNDARKRALEIYNKL